MAGAIVTGIRETLAVAVKRANLIYERCPEPKPNIFGPRWSELEDEVDAAVAAGQDDRARRAISAWIEYVEHELGGAK